jgi:hypothetical protein
MYVCMYVCMLLVVVANAVVKIVNRPQLHQRGKGRGRAGARVSLHGVARTGQPSQLFPRGSFLLLLLLL